MISQGGGYQPRWRGDGKELYYQTLNGQVMAVEVSAAGGVFQPGIPRPLFKTGSIGTNGWDVSADGTRFVVTIAGTAESKEAPFTLVLNWMAALKK